MERHLEPIYLPNQKPYQNILSFKKQILINSFVMCGESAKLIKNLPLLIIIYQMTSCKWPYFQNTIHKHELIHLFCHRSAFHKKRKPIIDKNEAFVIPTYVLQHTMNGQDWPDGDEVYHQWLVCETLIIYGEQDRLVTLQEEKNMAEVQYNSYFGN